MDEGKGFGFLWFDFLYGWFKFRVALEIFSLIPSILQICIYSKHYNTPPEILLFAYLLILCLLISISLKLHAITTKNKKNGYAAITFLFVWSPIYFFIWGLQAGITGALAAFLAECILVIPNFVYIHRRRFIYQIAKTTNNDSKQEAPSNKICFCRKCGEKLPKDDIRCNQCRTRIIH